MGESGSLDHAINNQLRKQNEAETSRNVGMFKSQIAKAKSKKELEDIMDEMNKLKFKPTFQAKAFHEVKSVWDKTMEMLQPKVAKEV